MEAGRALIPGRVCCKTWWIEDLNLLSSSLQLSARYFGLRIVDVEGVYVSESTVYCILKREGLVKPADVVGFKAGKEYHRLSNNGPGYLSRQFGEYLRLASESGVDSKRIRLKSFNEQDEVRIMEASGSYCTPA